VLLGIVLLITIQSNAQSFQISIPDVIVNENDVVLIPVSISFTNTSLGALSFDVVLDQNIVTATNCTVTAGGGAVFCNPANNNMVSAAGFATSGFANNVNFIEIEMEAIGEAGSQSILQITDVVAADLQGITIPDIAITSGSFSIDCDQNAIYSIGDDFFSFDTQKIEVYDYIHASNRVFTGAIVTYDAGNYVELLSNFEAYQGCNFEIVIDGCFGIY